MKIFIPVLLFGILVSCSENTPKKVDSQAIEGALESSKISLLTLKSGTITTTVNLTGEILPLDQASIYARTPGYIKEMKVDIGSRVKKGEILARLEAPEINANQAQTKSASMGQYAKYISSKNILARLQKASATDGAVSENEVDLALNQMKSDSAAYKASLSALNAGTAIENYLIIRAPFSGIITARAVNKGDFVDNGGKMKLFQIENNSSLRIEVPVPEMYNATLLKNEEASFTVSARPGEVFKAKLARKSNALSQDTRSETWEFLINNQTNVLKPGMFAQITLALERPKPGFWVPFKSVLTTQERKCVILSVGGKAHWVDVKTGFSGMDKVEISGNLKEGNLILQAPNEEIKDGSDLSLSSK